MGLAVATDSGQIADGSPGSPGQGLLSASYLNSPIRINSDAELVSAVASYGWAGNGTEANPYIILASINAGYGSYAIYVANTNLFFTISGCSLRNTNDGGSVNYSGAAIIFYNVANASVQGGSIYSCYRGISIIDSSNVNITEVSLSSIYYYGIKVVSSDHITLDSNYVYSYYDNKIHLVSTTASTVRGNSISGSNYDGILLESANGNIIFGNTVYSRNSAIELASSNDNMICNNSLSAGYYGLHVGTSSGSIIENNSVSSCGNYGIYIETSMGGQISNNNLYGSSAGIRFSHSSSFLLRENIVSNAIYGVYLDNSDGIVQINNTYQDCSVAGSSMYYSDDNLFFNNTLVRCSFYLDGDIDTFITQTIPTNNTVNGAPVYYYKNDDLGNASVPSDAGQVILGKVDNLVIEGLNLSDQTIGLMMGYSSFITVVNNTFEDDSPYGIYSLYSTDVTIRGNNLSDCQNGMYLVVAEDFLITGNNVSDSTNGIYLSSSSGIKVFSNTIIACQNSGIRIDYSAHNTFFGNDLRNCSFDINGYQSIYTEQSIEPNNTVNGRPVYYYHDIDFGNASVPADAGQVIMGNVHNAHVEGLDLSNQTTGLLIGYSSSITVENCTFGNDSPCGMRMYQSVDSIIRGNSYLNCNIGSYLVYGSDGNLFTGNEFFDCSECLTQESSHGSTIVNNTFSGDYGVRLWSSNGNEITGNEFSGLSDGISIYYSSSNTVEGNEISGVNNGIYAYDSDSNTIHGNQVNGSSNNAIYLDYCQGNQVTENTISNSNSGVYSYSSSSNMITGNTILNSYNGICSYYSSGSTISENVIDGCERGVYLNYYSNEYVSSNNINGSQEAGIYVYLVNNLELRGNNVTESQTGIYFDYCASFTVEANNLSECQRGISVYNCHSGTVMENNLSECQTGIYSGYSYSNSFLDNDIDGGSIGIEISGRWSSIQTNSDQNTIDGNDINGSDRAGILITDSTNNDLNNNLLTGCSIDLDGSTQTFSTQSIDETNTVNGRPVRYYANMDMTGITIPSGAGQVILGAVQNALVQGANLSNQTTGLVVGYSSHITVDGVIFDSDIEAGAHLYQTTNSLVTGSTFTDCKNGLNLELCRSTTVSSNEFSSCENGLYQTDTSTSNVIRYNNFSACTNGIYMEYASDSTATLNNITACEDGIHLTWSDSISLLYNVISDCSATGINLMSNYDTVTGNQMDNCTDGILLSSANQQSLIGNHINGSAEAGIRSDQSYGSIIQNNQITNCTEGIQLIASTQDYLNGNLVDSCYNGINVTTSTQENLEENTVNNSANIGIMIVTSEEISLSNNLIENSASYGVLTNTSMFCYISLNQFIDNNGAGEVYDPEHAQAFDDCYVYVDKDAPKYDWVSPYSGYTTTNYYVDFQWRAYDEGIGLGSSMIRVDGGEWFEPDMWYNEWDVYWYGYCELYLEEGTHIVDIVVIDGAGNQALRSITVTVDLDYEGPYYCSWWPSDGYISSDGYFYAYWYVCCTYYEPVSMEIRVDGGEWFEPDMWYNEWDVYWYGYCELYSLSEGTHVLDIMTIDEGGFEAMLSINFTVDFDLGSTGMGSPDLGLGVGEGFLPGLGAGEGSDYQGTTSWFSGPGNYWSDWLSPDDNLDGYVDSGYGIAGGNATDEHPLAYYVGNPYGLEAQPGSDYIELYWSGVNYTVTGQVDGYILFRNSSAGDNTTFLVGPDDYYYHDGTVISDVVYTYYLVAYIGEHRSGPSPAVEGMVDNVAPDVVIIAPEDGSWLNADYLQLQWNASDNGSGLYSFNINLNGEYFDTVYAVEGQAHYEYNLTDLEEGPCQIEVYAYDYNENEGYDSVEFGLDWSAPVIELYSPEDGAVNGTSEPMMDAYAGDDTSGISTYQVFLDGELLWNESDYGSDELEISDGLGLLDDGVHNLTFCVWDYAGNEAIVWSEFIVDTTPPVIHILAPAELAFNNTGNVTVVWQISEANLDHVEVRHCDGDWINVGLNTSIVITAPEGFHLVQVRAFDRANNNVTVYVQFTVDMTPPVISDLTPTDGDYVGTAVTVFTWNVTEAESGVNRTLVSVDSGTVVDIAHERSFTTAGLSDGWHWFNITVYDNATNSVSISIRFLVDTQGPVVTIENPADNAMLNDELVHFEWSGLDPVPGSGLARFEYNLDGTGWVDAAFTTGVDLMLVEGDHLFKVRAFDALGNPSTEQSISLTVDLTEPSLVITTPAEGSMIGSASVMVRWDGDDLLSGIGEYRVAIDGGAWIVVGTDASYMFSGLTDGLHHVLVNASDNAGNYLVRQVNFTTDVTSPQVAIIDPAEGTMLNVNGVTIEWTGSDALSGLAYFEIKVDDLAWENAGHNLTLALSGLSEGEHTFMVNAVDNVGNENTASVTFTVDITDPWVTITQPAAGSQTNAIDVQMDWTAVDNITDVAYIHVWNDTGAFVNLTSGDGYLFTGLSEGAHTLHVKVWDLAGNAQEKTVTISIDLTAPSMTITAPSEGQFLNSSTVDAQFDVADDMSGVALIKVRIDSDSWIVVIGSSHTFTGVGDGQHSIYVFAQDSVGNNLTESVQFTVDTNAPTITIVTPSPDEFTNSTSMRFEWSASDQTSALIGCQYRLDDGAWSPLVQDTEHDFTDLADGSHVLQLRAFDLVGNIGQAEVNFTVDTVAPEVTITAPEMGQLLNLTGASVRWTANGTGSPLAMLERSLDGGAWEALDASATESTFSALADGEHIISIKATDSAGNTMTATVRITVDTVAPAIIAKSPIGTGVPINATLTITFSEAMDEGSVVVTGITGTISWTGNTLGLEPGANLTYGSTYVIYVTGYDLAANQIDSNWEFTVMGLSKITGKLLDDTGKPIVGANITLDTGEWVLTNETGAFEFEVVPGNYTLTVWQDGVEIDQLTCLVLPGADKDLDTIVVESASNNIDPLILGAVMAAIIGSILIIILIGRWRKK